jgi:hypothetical protein
MATVKLNISLDAEVANTLRRRAAELRKPTSRYLADLIREEVRRHEDELAAEGYGALSVDTAGFAAAAWPLAVEVWSGWEDEASSQRSAHGSPEEGGDAPESEAEAR